MIGEDPWIYRFITWITKNENGKNRDGYDFGKRLAKVKIVRVEAIFLLFSGVCCVEINR